MFRRRGDGGLILKLDADAVIVVSSDSVMSGVGKGVDAAVSSRLFGSPDESVVDDGGGILSRLLEMSGQIIPELG